MSESTIPFNGAPAEAAPAEDPGSGGNRMLLVLAALGTVAVLGALAYFFLLSGGGEDKETAAPAPKPAPAAKAPAVPQPAEPTTVPQQNLNAKSFGRDPFKPLIVEAEAVADTTGTVAPAGTTTTDTTTTTETTTTEAGTTTESAETSEEVKDPVEDTSEPANSDAHTFKVVEVAPDNSTITVKVDGKEYKGLQAGEVFATYFKVILISGQVNSFQYGEEKFNVVGTKRLTIA